MGASIPSTRPYLIRALHQWCMDHGFTPYISVSVDGSVRVPRQHVVNDEIVLNVSTDATGGLVLGDEYIEFKARFGGVPQQIVVPVGRVSAIYARENGQGMAFPVEPSVYMADGSPSDSGALGSTADELSGDVPPDAAVGKSKAGARPALKRIK